MPREIYDFVGTQPDRSNIDMSFDGLNLMVFVEDQNRPGKKISLRFNMVLRFEWEFEGTLQNYPNEQSEKLIEQDAGDYLHNRKDNDHPFLSNDLKKFSVLFDDLGFLHVTARNVKVSQVR